MASRRTYTCFVCQKAGHEIQVFLDGRDSEGRTKYLNEDGTPHLHKTNKQGSEPTTTSLKIINAKLDRIVTLLTESNQRPQQK